MKNNLLSITFFFLFGSFAYSQGYEKINIIPDDFLDAPVAISLVLEDDILVNHKAVNHFKNIFLDLGINVSIFELSGLICPANDESYKILKKENPKYIIKAKLQGNLQSIMIYNNNKASEPLLMYKNIAGFPDKIIGRLNKKITKFKKKHPGCDNVKYDRKTCKSFSLIDYPNMKTVKYLPEDIKNETVYLVKMALLELDPSKYEGDRKPTKSYKTTNRMIDGFNQIDEKSMKKYPYQYEFILPSEVAAKLKSGAKYFYSYSTSTNKDVITNSESDLEIKKVTSLTPYLLDFENKIIYYANLKKTAISTFKDSKRYFELITIGKQIEKGKY